MEHFFKSYANAKTVVNSAPLSHWHPTYKKRNNLVGFSTITSIYFAQASIATAVSAFETVDAASDSIKTEKLHKKTLECSCKIK